MPQLFRTLSVALVVGGGFFGGTPSIAKDQPPAYVAIDVPGSTFTTAQGINPRGDVVGWYVDATDKRPHAYVLEDGVFTRFDYPGAIYTDARGINARGDIVGAYRLLGEPAVNFHGYLRSKDGAFEPVDFPGWKNTIPQRITPDGWIFGCRHQDDLGNSMHGITMNRRSPDTGVDIEVPMSMNNGALPGGDVIVGLYTEMETNRGRGYVLNNGDFIPFDAPGSVFTAAWDISPSGVVVGVYRDTAQKFHGFRWDGDGFSAIDYPTAVATRAFGVDARGDIVGAYLDSANRTHGFVAIVPDSNRP